MSSTIWHRTWSGTGLSVIIISFRNRSKGRDVDAVLPASGRLAQVRPVGEVEQDGPCAVH